MDVIKTNASMADQDGEVTEGRSVHIANLNLTDLVDLTIELREVLANRSESKFATLRNILVGLEREQKDWIDDLRRVSTPM